MILSLKKNYFSFLFIISFILVINFAIFKNDTDLILSSCVVLGMLMVAYWLTFYKNILFPIVLFLVPLSFTFKIGGGTTIDFPSEIIVGLLVLIVLLRSLSKPVISVKLLYHPITILLFIELAWMLLASTSSNVPVFSFKRCLVRFCYLLVFYLVAATWLKDPKKRRLFFLLYMVGIIIPVIHTIYRHSLLDFGKEATYRMSRPFYSDHTIYGAAIAFVLPALFILLYNYKNFGFKKLTSIGIFFGILILLAGEIFSFSRAAWVSLFVALIFYFLVKLRIRIQMLILAIAVLISSAFIFKDQLIESVRQNESVSSKGSLVEHVESVTNLQTDASNLERVNRWVCAIRMAKERPVLGFGPGMYQYEYGRFQTRDYMTRISTFKGTNGHAHSELFNSLAECGIPGALIYIVLMFTIIGYGLFVVYNAKEKQDRAIALCALLGLVTFYIHGFFNAFLDTDKMASLVFGSIAMLVCLDLNQRMEKRSSVSIEMKHSQ